MSEQTTTDGAEGGGIEAMMGPEMAREPQPTYAALAASTPAMRVEGIGVVACSRATVDEVLRQPDLFSSNAEAVDLKNRRPLIPLQIDPPDHKKFRRILDPLFAPQKMRLLEEPIARLVHERIDAFGDAREIDFSRQFSVPFPSQVFLELFGLPTEELPTFLAMKDGIIRPAHVVGTDFGHPDALAHQQATSDSVYEYFEALLDERADERRDDILSQFLDAEVDGERLTRDEIVDICFLFLIAGLDTVSASLDCFFGYLAQHPAERRRIVEDPEAIQPVVEELLRWETPVVGVPRVATRDTVVGGVEVQAGEHVMALLGAANVDTADLPDATEVRWDRDANRHLAFGGGVHRCLGSNLARVELRVALREWHRRIPDYRVKPGVELDYTAGIRSLDTFPMVLGESL